MSDIEKVLINRALIETDGQAFGRLIALHQSAIRGFLRRLTKGDHALADDLAQDCFLRAYTKLEDYRGDGSFKAWLFRIAYTAFLQDRRRPIKRETPQDLDDYLNQRPSPQDHGDARMDIEAALTQLGEIERAALTLSLTYGLSHSEAATAMDLPLGTVKSHILRGKAKLREMLAIWQGEMIS